MGGKKKTKWRKLPLEEFTNDSSKFKRRRSSEEIKPDYVRKEEKYAQNTSYPEMVEENSQPFNGEYVENSESTWYPPTQYLVYNPVEVPVYHQNYMIPTDNNCYYYPPTEMNTVADYTGVPFQEFVPNMKDTVYLVFPASALRQTQYSSYDWRNRRRRRRYNGYAEYAVIPDKSNIGDKPNEKKGNNSTPAKNATQPRQFEKTISNSEKNDLDVLKHTAQSRKNKSTDIKLDDKGDIINKMGLSKSERNEESSSKQKKLVDVCDVHSQSSKQDSKSNLHKNLQKNNCDLPNSSSANNPGTKDAIEELNEMSRLELNSNEQPIEKILPDKTIQFNKENINNLTVNEINTDGIKCNNPNDAFSDGQTSNKIFNQIENENQEEDSDCKESTLFSNSNQTYMAVTNCEKAESDQNNFNQSSLPDIISNVNEATHYVDENTESSSLSDSYRTQNFSALHNARNINECTSKVPSVSATRSAYLPYLYNTNSDVLSSENKIADTKQPKSQSLYTNNSIYKLAFDESLTDQSDTESRSPSPIERFPIDRNPFDEHRVDRNSDNEYRADRNSINEYRVDRPPVDEHRIDRGSVDPESQVPSSLMSNEINVYEADSEDDAGSEDLELIPHRYESESFLNKSKHLYENRLSLAVELLRTKESLPYDAQFKRVIEDSQECSKTESGRTGEVNMGFVDDINSFDSIELKSNNLASNMSDHETITQQCKIHKPLSPNSVSYDIPLDDSFTNSYELADEVIAQSANHQDDNEEVNAGYRRIGVQFRHYFSPSSTLVNPWNCCTIM